jgi:DNA-binding NarL/FixJ family response regulator
MTVSTPTVLVAAAPTLLRQGLVATLRQQWPELQLILTADATQVDELVQRQYFKLVLLDRALPGRTLSELLARLHCTRPSQRLAVLTDQARSIQQAQSQGWPGAPLQLPWQVLPHALVAVLAGWLDAPDAAVPPMRPLVASPVPEPFSPRELEVLRLVVADYCNEEIANHLFINVRTVETHRRNLIQKAGTRTLVGLAARAVREGWVA